MNGGSLNRKHQIVHWFQVCNTSGVFKLYISTPSAKTFSKLLQIVNFGIGFPAAPRAIRLKTCGRTTFDHFL